jgi:hypothetical protein
VLSPVNPAIKPIEAVPQFITERDRVVTNLTPAEPCLQSTRKVHTYSEISIP